jgi:hypothetical protein
MNQAEFNALVNADIQRLMVPPKRSFVVTVLSRTNHYDDITVEAISEDDAIDHVLDTRAYDIRTLFCNNFEVSV